jgi:hypothetical protein
MSTGRGRIADVAGAKPWHDVVTIEHHAATGDTIATPYTCRAWREGAAQDDPETYAGWRVLVTYTLDPVAA